MDYLKELSFSEMDIEDIKKSNYPYILDNLEIDIENLFEMCLEKGTIKNIFIDQVSLFFKTKKEIQMSFDEYEIESIVKSLNYDANNVELIDFV